MRWTGRNSRRGLSRRLIHSRHHRSFALILSKLSEYRLYGCAQQAMALRLGETIFLDTPFFEGYSPAHRLRPVSPGK